MNDLPLPGHDDESAERAATLSTRFQTIYDQLRFLDSEVSRLEQEHGQIHMQMDEIQSKLETTRRERDDLRGQLTDVQARLAATEKQLTEARRIAELYQHDYAVRHGKVDEDVLPPRPWWQFWRQ